MEALTATANLCGAGNPACEALSEVRDREVSSAPHRQDCLCHTVVLPHRQDCLCSTRRDSAFLERLESFGQCFFQLGFRD